MDMQNFRIHSLYTRYASDRDGNIFDLFKNKMIKIQTMFNGYKQISIYTKEKYISYLHLRFVYECFYGIIPEGRVIDHIDNVKTNNNIENLQCVTPQENCKKSAANRDYSFVKDNHKNRKSVQSTCIETGEKDYFPSMY